MAPVDQYWYEAAKAYGPRINQPTEMAQKDTRPWREIVGRKVAVEGIARTGYHGLGDIVATVDGDEVHLRNVDVDKENAGGKLIRVIGILEKERIEGIRHYGDAGFAGDFDAYYIRVTEWKVLDRTNWPWMKLAD
jgi:hypothetical protein